MSTEMYIFMTSMVAMIAVMIAIGLVEFLPSGTSEHKIGGHVEPKEDACEIKLVMKTNETVAGPSDDIYMLTLEGIDKRVRMLECEHGYQVKYERYRIAKYSIPPERGQYKEVCVSCGKILRHGIQEDEYHELKAKEHLSKVTKKSDEGEVKS